MNLFHIFDIKTQTDLYFYSILILLAVIFSVVPFFQLILDKLTSYSKTFFSFISYPFLIKTDFILRITPQRKNFFLFFKKSYQPNHPPPGYGIPYNKQSKFKKSDLPENYNMVLSPGGLNKWYFGMTTGISCIVFLPISIYWYCYTQKNNISPNISYACAIYAVSFASIFLPICFYTLFARGKSVLGDTWAGWPKPCNHMLASVPHKVSIYRKDQTNKKLKQYPAYWNPNIQTTLFRQPKQYAPDSPTLQGVLLNFAIFEVFFNKTSKTKKKSPSPKISNTFNIKMWAKYWMAPVWSSYLLLAVGMITYFILTKSMDIPHTDDLIFKLDSHILTPHDSKPNDFLLNGGTFAIGIIIWIISTSFFIHLRLGRLTDLRNKIQCGYFEQHEDLVPQQVLNRLADIPTEKQISNVIKKAGVFYKFLVFGAFVNFLLIFDILK